MSERNYKAVFFFKCKRTHNWHNLFTKTENKAPLYFVRNNFRVTLVDGHGHYAEPIETTLIGKMVLVGFVTIKE